MTVVVVSLRESARSLPLAERERRRAVAEAATSLVLLRAVVAAAIGAGEWRSATQAAEDVFVVDPRSLRRMLDGKLGIPDAIRLKSIKLAWAFGVEVPCS